jgi:sporulation protein YlmC with PRC-barrel domain
MTPIDDQSRQVRGARRFPDHREHAEMSDRSRPGAGLSHSVEDFHFGAEVDCSDGTRIGTLRRVVLDRDTLDVHSIVVKESRRFSGHYFAGTALVEDDIAIPIKHVLSADHDRVALSTTPAEVRRTEPYLTYQYAPLSKADAARMAISLVTQTNYIPHLIESAHKRLDELAINPGENVMLGRTGRRLGTVRDVVMDEGELVGVVMHPVGFFAEDVLLQVRFLGRSDDLALFAHLTETDLAHLKPFQPSTTSAQ